MLIVTEPAADLQLLSEEELRVAAGLDSEDDSQDEALAVQGLRAAAALAGACGVAVAGYDASLAPLRGAAPRTLKAETLVETIRVRPGYQYMTLVLARWPVLEIVSVTTDTTGLTAADYYLDIPMGTLDRISGNETLFWPCGWVTVEYVAGYDEIPEDLKGYCGQLMSIFHQTATSAVDPSTKHIEIPGVITLDRWVDQTATDSIVPDDIKTGLVRDGYRRPVLAWSLATETRSLYRQYLSEPVSIRRITGIGTGRTDTTYATVGRLNASNNAARKELTGGIAQQDLTAIIYSQSLFDNGLPSDVVIGDYLIDQDGIEHSVYEVQARRVEGVLVAYELTVRA